MFSDDDKRKLRKIVYTLSRLPHNRTLVLQFPCRTRMFEVSNYLIDNYPCVDVVAIIRVDEPRYLLNIRKWEEEGD